MVRSIDLETEADVAGITRARVEALAHHTQRTCVISRALAAVPMTLQVRQQDDD
jgi:organic hydroperoxide reductase OsmC/OhrA